MAEGRGSVFGRERERDGRAKEKRASGGDVRIGSLSFIVPWLEQMITQRIAL